MDYSKLEDYNESDSDGNLVEGDSQDERDGLEIDTISDLSVLQKLKRSVERKEKATAVYPVPEGQFADFTETVELEFSTQITTNELNRFQKLARGKKRGDDVDAGKASALVLAEKSIAIYINGKQLVDEDGDAMTLRSEGIMSLTGARTAADGVRGLLGDGVTTSMSDSLVSDAGYGDTFDSTGNPTSRA